MQTIYNVITVNKIAITISKTYRIATYLLKLFLNKNITTFYTKALKKIQLRNDEDTRLTASPMLP